MSPRGETDIISAFGAEVLGSNPGEGTGDGMKIRNPKLQNQKLILTAVLAGFFLFSANQVLAICEGPIVPCGFGGDQCHFCHVFVLIDNIIAFILTCLTPVAAGFMIIIGGIYLLIAGGSPGLFDKAKKALTGAVIGLVVIFVAWVFLNTFFTYIGVAEWTGFLDDPATPEEEGWFEIKCP